MPIPLPAFPMAVFITYGAHWVNLGYDQSVTADLPAAFGKAGALSPEYNGGNGMYNVVMALVTFCFLCASIRVNVPFVITFTSVFLLFSFLAAADFNLAAVPSEAGLARTVYLAYVAGACGFPAALCGWYLAIITACASTGVPCPLPVFDLSTKVFPGSQAAKNEAAGAGGSAVARSDEES